MVCLEWKDDLDLNIESIDKQHKILIESLNNLEETFYAELHKDFLLEVDNHIGFVEIHFKTEEALLEKVKYIDIENHKKEHDNYKIVIQKIKKDFSSGEEENVRRLVKYIKMWFPNHIKKVDSKYVDILKQNNIQ